MNAIATAVKKVMKNTRAQYSSAITTPRLITGKARACDTTDSSGRETNAIYDYYRLLRARIADMRILALDLGKRRIGLAISDELGITAQGLPTLQRKNNRTDLAALNNIVREKAVDLILIGEPLHMSGDAGTQAQNARQFSELLARHTGKDTKLWDERLTTVEASRVLRDSGIGIEKRAKAIDRLSAVILLQSYLDFRASGEGR
jgi:putative Holliday junction resolvase